MTRPDLIRFIGGPVGRLEVGWTGPWPPPEYLTVAYGNESGIAKVVPEGFDLSVIAEAASIEVTVYRLKQASKLGGDGMFHGVQMVRGAEYVPDAAVIR